MLNKLSSFATSAKSLASSTLKSVGNKAVDAAKTSITNAIADRSPLLGAMLRSQNVSGLFNNTQPTTNAAASFNTPVDWRVRLTIPAGYDKSAILKPIVDIGYLVFPYTPQISISHSASYQSLEPVHSNFQFQSYQRSKIEEITITAAFHCEDADEAAYWTAAVHYFRSVTKMIQDSSNNNGAPPPVVKLSGYGDYVFNNIPVVVTGFSVELPNNVDYISSKISGIGQDATSPTGVGYVPVSSTFTVRLQPVYSREQARRFNLTDFVNGKLVIDNTGFM